MNTTRIVSGRHSNSKRTGRGHHWPVKAAMFALALCIGISPLAAQTITNFTRLTGRLVISDPNSTAGKDPNAATVSDPNQTAATDPNQIVAVDPNAIIGVDPNQTTAIDPNQTVAVDPNQVIVEPNQITGGTSAGQFNKSGNILIADRLNHRIIEVDRDTHEIVWQFGDGSSVAGPTSIVAPSDAERVGEWTLICGASVAASTDPNAEEGSGDHRVLLVDASGKTFWQYGQAGVAGSDVNQLNTPVGAVFLPYGNTLICDQGNHRVIEVSLVSKTIVWQHGTTGTSGTGRDHLCSPGSAQLLDNGNILIADTGNNRVIEVSRRHRTVWQCGDSNSGEALNGPSFACRLENGNILITDSGHNRILETDRRGRTVMEFAPGKQPGSVADPLPTRAVRLDNGNTLISDQFNHQVIEIDSDLNVVFAHGSMGAPGNGYNQLSGPCDAKVIGDCTGLTPPSLDFYWDCGEDSEPPDRDHEDRDHSDRERYDRQHDRDWRR
jgi:outer membrane protein assembly factor BamB